MRSLPAAKRTLFYTGLALLAGVVMLVARIAEYNRIAFTKQALRKGLDAAVLADDLFAVRIFLLMGVDPNTRTRDEFGTSSLNLAIMNGNASIVKTLLAHGADPNGVIDCEGTEIAPTLWPRELTASYESHFHTPVLNGLNVPLVQAALRREDEIVDLLRDHGASYGILTAIALNDEALARSELEKRPDVRQAIRDLSDQILAIAQESKNKAAMDLMAKLDLISPESERRRRIGVM